MTARFIDLHDDLDWERLLEASDTAPQIVYKHSATCGSSSWTYGFFDAALTSGELEHPVHMVTIQRSRPLSNRIAHDLDVRHESPQVFVIWKRQAVFHDSHGGVRPEPVIAAIAALEENPA
jgi:bacillithiol system protein YtxJ